jgi:hypothetical protein
MADPSLCASGLPIPALGRRRRGHRFVLYGDACSGVAGAPHEQIFARLNAVLRRLRPPPFIRLPGDEIIGLTGDAETLRLQWRHVLDHEMASRPCREADVRQHRQPHNP